MVSVVYLNHSHEFVESSKPCHDNIMMYEYTANFHQHTTASDGTASHEEVIQAGIEAGLDVMMFTDHNIYLPDKEGWYQDTLVLMGIEVNDTNIKEEINHYLCFGVDHDLNEYAAEPQRLIDAVNEMGGIGFIAHPFERPAPHVNEPAIPWLDWSVDGYVGIEIWNYMSEWKSYLTNHFTTVRAAFFPDVVMTSPFPETLSHWDKLMSSGHKVVAIGNSDAHCFIRHIGSLTLHLFPYKDLFQAIRNHLLMNEPLSQDVSMAKQQILQTLKSGHCFVAYDHIESTRGFYFIAKTKQETFVQGDEFSLPYDGMIELIVQTPHRAEIRLLKDGELRAKVRGCKLTYAVSSPGVYRVECYRIFKTKWRGWIYSNPIYIR